MLVLHMLWDCCLSNKMQGPVDHLSKHLEQVDELVLVVGSRV